MSEVLFICAAIVIMIPIVVAINSTAEKGKQHRTEQARDQWESEEDRYAAVIKKLPSDLVKKLFDYMAQAGRNMSRATPGDYPGEYMKITFAAKKVMDTASYGTITKEQHQQITAILDEDLKWIVNDFIPAANQALAELQDSDGLGFGLITNSAADAMLYSAMDTHDKIKGNERRLREHREMIDKHFTALIHKIENTLS